MRWLWTVLAAWHVVGTGCRGGAIGPGRDGGPDAAQWQDGQPDRAWDAGRWDRRPWPDASPDSSADGCVWEPEPWATVDLPMLPVVEQPPSYFVDVWGHKVAYLDVPADRGVLHVFDFETQQEVVVGEDDLDAGVLQGMGMIRGDLVVYERLYPKGTYVWLYLKDLASGQVELLDEGPYLGLNGHMAWPYLAYTQCVQGCDVWGDKYDLLLLNMETGDRRVLVYHAEEPIAFPGGAGPYVMWLDLVPGYGVPILVYDIEADQTWMVEESANAPDGPSGSWWGHRLVWARQTAWWGGRDVFVTDMRTRQTRQLTTSPEDQGGPKVWQSVVLWPDYRWSHSWYGADHPKYDLALQDLDNGIRLRVTSCPAGYLYGLGEGWMILGLPQDPEAQHFRVVAYDLRAVGIMDEDGHLLPNPELEF